MKTAPESALDSLLIVESMLSDGEEEDDSLSSTLCVESPPKKAESQRLLLSSSSSFSSSDNDDLSSVSSNRSRVVCFDESANVCHANTLYAEEDCLQLWYSAEEYHNFKSAASFMAKMIDRAEGGGFTRRDPLSYTGILETVYLNCCGSEILEGQEEKGSACRNSAELERLKNLFLVEIGLGRLGLERRSVRFVAKDKSRRRNDLLAILLDKKSGSNNCVEELRRKCENISLASRLFAQRLALAAAPPLNVRE